MVSPFLISRFCVGVPRHGGGEGYGDLVPGRGLVGETGLVPFLPRPGPDDDGRGAAGALASPAWSSSPPAREMASTTWMGLVKG